MKHERRSAKSVIEQYAIELQARVGDPALDHKLDVLMSISNRMGWSDLFHKLKMYKLEKKEQWWQK